MFIILNNDIKITAGDTASVKIDLVDNDNNPLTITGELVFTVRKTINSPVQFIKTTMSDTFILNAEDTQELSGMYVYSITYLVDGASYTVADGFMTVIGDLYEG